MVLKFNIIISSSIFLGIVFLFSTCNSDKTNIQKSSQDLNNPIEEVKTSNQEIIDTINSTGKLDEEIDKKLTLIIQDFKKKNK